MSDTKPTTCPNPSTHEDAINTIILASLEAQRAAVEVLEDIDLCEAFASATTKTIDRYLIESAWWRAAEGPATR